MLNTLPTRTSPTLRPPCLFAWWVLVLSPAAALADDGEIEYQSAPARVTANVERWGQDCGVRPKSYTLSERPHVAVTRQGEHLTLRFPSDTVFSNQCWSKNPALQRVSTSARTGVWKTRCETPAGDPKQETGVYEIVARDSQTLELTESSRYDWQLKTSHCIATVRTVRTLTRTSPTDGAAETLPVAEPVAEPAAAAAPPPVEPDCVPGSLASLQIIPGRGRVEPGNNLCFAARGKDTDGCVIKNPPVSWSVKALDHGQGRMHGNCFRSAASAAEGEGRFRVTASTGKLSARALVRVATPDLSDITLHAVPGAQGGPLAPSGHPGAEGASGEQFKTHVAARSVDELNESGLLVALAALAAALGAGATWLALRKRRRRGAPPVDLTASGGGRDATPPPPSSAAQAPPRRGPSADTAPPSGGAALPGGTKAGAPRAPQPAPAAARPQATEPMICPTCRRGYAPGAERCESDGSALMTYKAFTAQASAGQATCTACGASLEADSSFCGKCGSRLSS